MTAQGSPPSPSLPPQGASELQKRVLSGIVMAAVAIGTAFLGGWPFAILWTGASIAVAWEWQKLVHGDDSFRPFGITALAVVLAAASVMLARPEWLLVLPLFAVLNFALSLAGDRAETAQGVFYAAGLCAAMLLCRGQGREGLVVIGWLFAVVWGTDILAYFTGRALGGPKLWPAVSPKKTWSGAIGGLVGGVLLGCALLWFAGIAVGWPHIVLGIAFSVLTQGGDLFESAMKRRHDAKDSGTLIPGHGGFMDRLDGFIFAVIGAAVFGVVRSGFAAVPQGLLLW